MNWLIGITRSFVLALPLALQAAYVWITGRRQDRKIDALLERKKRMLTNGI